MAGRIAAADPDPLLVPVHVRMHIDGGISKRQSAAAAAGSIGLGSVQQQIRMQADFARCLTEKMLVYALGRGLKPYDKRTVTDIDTKLAATGFGFQSLVSEVVRSLPFQQRRGEEVSETTPVTPAAKPKQVASK